MGLGVLDVKRCDLASYSFRPGAWRRWGSHDGLELTRAATSVERAGTLTVKGVRGHRAPMSRDWSVRCLNGEVHPKKGNSQLKHSLS
jgi:hypothetical protein